MPISFSPLRYPGGKTRLTNYIKLILQVNELEGGVYAEPFAGGAGVAIGLLLDNCVEKIYINDIDPSIFAFWHSVLYETESLCSTIQEQQVNMTQWYKQKEIFSAQDTDNLLELGFATFFLNRTNRSGILNAGVIGGKHQTGKWKLDARYNKEKLIEKIQAISAYKDNIVLTNLDVRHFIDQQVAKMPKNTLVYLDPPYFHKGQKLYLNALEPDDHILISYSVINDIHVPWITSYDNTSEITKLYSNYQQAAYPLNYTAADRYHGKEVIIYSEGLTIPHTSNPFKINKTEFENAYTHVMRINSQLSSESTIQ